MVWKKPAENNLSDAIKDDFERYAGVCHLSGSNTFPELGHFRFICSGAMVRRGDKG